jgi:sporulation delaying protein B
VRVVAAAVRKACAQSEVRGRGLALARSCIAAAQLGTLAATSDQGLFGGGRSGLDARCDRHAGSLWCLPGLSDRLLVARMVAIVVLGLVVSGYRPKLTCIPHWYVSFSLFGGVVAPNGGDAVAVIATMLVVPACLGDNRRWQWRGPDSPMPAKWRGSALAANYVMRLQIAVIYAMTAVSKLADPAWQHGIAMSEVFRDVNYAPAPGLDTALSSVADFGPVGSILGWSVIFVEFAIAVLVLGRRRRRVRAFALVVLLHVPIGVLLGLPSFALIMIGFVAMTLGRTEIPAAGALAEEESAGGSESIPVRPEVRFRAGFARATPDGGGELGPRPPERASANL